MKAQRWVKRVAGPSSLILVLNGVGGQRHASASLSPRKSPRTCTGGWAGLDECGKSHLLGDSNSESSCP